MNSINEKILKDYLIPIFIDKIKIILNQMQKCVVKICNQDGSNGTGFFCKIKLNSEKYLPVLITNNHVINEKEEKIGIITNNGQNKKTLNIKNKFKYANIEYDVMIISLKEEDMKDNNIYEYLELDDDIMNNNDYNINYIGKSIYILHYPDNFEKDEVAVSFGILKNRSENENEKYNFFHFCSTGYGSSGSPILNLSKNKIIGIHKQKSKKEELILVLFYLIQLKNL